MIGGVRCEEDKFLTSLAKDEEEGKEKGDDVEPGTDRDVDGERPGGGTQDKSAGDRKDVEDHDVLHDCDVQGLQDQVGQGSRAERGRKHGCGGECADGDHEGGGEGKGRWHHAGSDRTE